MQIKLAETFWKNA